MKIQLLILLSTACIGTTVLSAQDDLQSFQNAKPAFEISIPDEMPDWEIQSRDMAEKPFIILKNSEDGIPFIDVYIHLRDDLPEEIQDAWSRPEEIFASKTAEEKRFEKEVLPDVIFVSDRFIEIAGLPAYDRIYSSAQSGITYHTICILFPDGIVTFGLNAHTDNFSRDDEGFTAILDTLKKF